MASVSSRLISSGIVRSKLRRPGLNLTPEATRTA